MTLDNFPTTRPAFTANFARSQQMPPQVTFSRASQATSPAVPSPGTVTGPTGPQLSDYNTPRFAWENGKCQGLLIEESRTNTLTHSAEFDNAAWTTTDASVTPNASTSPGGTLTADKLVENTVNNDHSVFDTTPISKTSPSFSCFVKADGRNFINLRLIRSGLTERAYATFDLSDGSVTDQGTIGTFFTNVQVQSESVGNSWYRFSISAASTSDVIRVSLDLSDVAVPTRNNGAPVYLGDGTSGVYVWGAQLETGSFPTSYIPTSGATATRAPDQCQITGTDFSSWYNNGSEGTIVTTASSADAGTSSNYNIVYLGGGASSGNNRICSTVGSTFTAFAQTTTLDINFAGAVYTSNVAGKGAFGYKPDDSALYVDGSAVAASNNGDTIPTTAVNRMYIGMNRNETNQINGYISNISYYSTRVSNDALEALTQ